MSSQTAEIKKAFVVVESAAAQALVEDVAEAASCDAPALIIGEPGTGRELVARMLHFHGPRAARPFECVEAGAAPRPLVRDRLDKKGAGPLARAAGGTLLVKDLIALPRESQRRLDRAVRSDSGADVRVLGACNDDIAAAVDRDVFHRPLYDRMAEHTIAIPPLRERVTDIPPLTVHFVREYAREIGRGRMTLSTRAFERLVRYPWPGNVGELKTIARRVVIRARRSRIEAADIDAVLPAIAERAPLEELSLEDMVRHKLVEFLKRTEGYPVDGLYDAVIGRVERPLLALVMEHTGHNQLKAAEILGLNRNTLRRKLGEHGIHARTKRAGGTPSSLRASKS